MTTETTQPPYLLDRTGDLWTLEDDGRYQFGDVSPRSAEAVAERYGPLTPLYPHTPTPDPDLLTASWSRGGGTDVEWAEVYRIAQMEGARARYRRGAGADQFSGHWIESPILGDRIETVEYYLASAGGDPAYGLLAVTVTAPKPDPKAALAAQLESDGWAQYRGYTYRLIGEIWYMDGVATNTPRPTADLVKMEGVTRHPAILRGIEIAGGES